MKIGVVSLGCPKNLVDSEVMMGYLRERGHELTSDPGEADVIVVNTCSFIHPAQQESVDTILEMAEYKRTGRLKRLVVAGCLVERFGGEIQRELPEVDAIIGVNEIERIVEACEGRSWDGRPAQPYLYSEASPRVLATPSHYAYVKIAEGCDHTCSFCIIPKIRGPFRSRTPESIQREVAALFARGIQEINLVGQDTTSYGEDLGLRDGLAYLLERLARLPGAEGRWIRFLYAYPNRITQRLLEVIAEYDPLVKYIDLPLQHASRRVLKRMRRGGSAEGYLRLIERIRKTIPGVAIRTTMIVGFPGETQQDFDELCQFVEAAEFDWLGVFGYCDEETAASYRLDGKVDGRTIYHRKRRLMAIQRKITRRRLRALRGKEFVALLEALETPDGSVWRARLPIQAPEIDGVCYVTDPEARTLRAGERVCVRIVNSGDYDVVGEVVAVERSVDGPGVSPGSRLTVVQTCG